MNNNKEREESKELSPEQVQKRKKMVIFPLMFSGFLLAIYFIFMPSGENEEIKKGLNADLPIPKNEIIGDKRTAYEQELFRTKKKRTLSLKDYGIESDTVKNEVITQSINTVQKNKESSIRSSASAYKSINRDLNTFYQPLETKEPSREKELKSQIEQLQNQLENKEDEKEELVNQQLRVMEESYKMAAKYMPNQKQQNNQALPSDTKKTERIVYAVSKLNSKRVASSLAQNISDSVFAERFSKPLNMGFLTKGIDKEKYLEKNTIKACVHNEQIIISGQSVKLRLLETIQVENLIIPKHEIITGIANMQGERLDIQINSIEYSGKIIPVKMQVFDVDGQLGLFIPSSMERNAAKDILAQMGQQGTQASISVNQQSAVEQLAVDLGRNIIEGGSKYLSKKIQTVKVKLKSGHKLMLLPEQN